MGSIFIIGTMIAMYNLPNNSMTSLDNTEALKAKYLQSVSEGISDSTIPLLEEEEQRILNAADDELNKFPISVGVDDPQHENPDWETILHPGYEALMLIHGEDYLEKIKKQPTAVELAAVLSGNNVNTDTDSSEKHGLQEGYMRVPKLWDPPVYGVIADEREHRGVKASKDLPRDGIRRYLGNFGSRLMTPSEAKSIGSRIPSKETGELLETIFIGIASYRDWQCSSTVESAFQRAAHPERIRIGVVDQIHLGEDDLCSKPPNGSCEENPTQAICLYKDQIDFLTLDAALSVGPVFARHLGYRLYRGEYFVVQSDAHVAFVQGWDDEIIAQWHTARNEMAILTAYVSGVDDHIDLKTGKRTSKARPIMCMSDFEGSGKMKHLRHGQQPEGDPHIHDMPTLEPFWAAGFSFGRGHFVVNIPYDQHLPWIFQGEEISIGLRGFSYGYDYYTPEKAAMYHFYGRKEIPMFWENTQKYKGSGYLGMNRLNSIIHMQPKSEMNHTWIRTDEIKYGLGQVRDINLFFETFGIHVETQTVEAHLCTFVGKPMQKKFIPYLRPNEMGIDYDKLNYRFVDPKKKKK